MREMSQHYKGMVTRHKGIWTEEQQLRLLNAKVAVGGLGMGGSVFIDLVRMGVGSFNVADLDVYELSNSNRQRMAKSSTLGTYKLDCCVKEAKDLHPDVQIAEFPKGVLESNVVQFVEGCDVVVDTIDVFAYREKVLMHKAAQERGIPVVICFAVGFGAVCTTFPYNRPDCPSYEQVTGTSVNNSSFENIKAIVKWMDPIGADYLKPQIDEVLAGRGSFPFSVSGVEMCGSLGSTAVTEQILYNRGVYAPHVMYFSPFELTAAGRNSVVRL